MIKAEEIFSGAYRPDREGGALDWLVCISDSMPFSVSENWLALEGAVSPQAESFFCFFFKMSKHSKIQKQTNKKPNKP